MTIYKKGDMIKIRDDLLVDHIYYGANKTSQMFTRRMEKYMGKKAEITRVLNMGYKISIDPIHIYTDEMIEDLSINNPYTFNPTIEELLQTIKKQYFYGAMDRALDQKSYETDPEKFKSILFWYEFYCVDKNKK